MTKSCPHCLSDNPAAARHCRRCGRQLSVDVASATRITPLMQRWRSLKRDLTRQEVKKLLGEPLRIELPPATSGQEQERWTYEYLAKNCAQPATAVLCFEAWDGRLVSWSEPDWKQLGLNDDAD